MKKGKLSLLVASPAIALLMVSFFIPYTFSGALTLVLAYFLSYATVSGQLRQKSRHRRYRFSFLRFIMGFLALWDFVRPGQYPRLKRLITPLLFSLLQVLMMGLSFWYLPLCALAGWGFFEWYYKKFLKNEVDLFNAAQRDDPEIPPTNQNAESESAFPLDSQSPQIDSDKNS